MDKTTIDNNKRINDKRINDSLKELNSRLDSLLGPDIEGDQVSNELDQLNNLSAQRAQIFGLFGLEDPAAGSLNNMMQQRAFMLQRHDERQQLKIGVYSNLFNAQISALQAETSKKLAEAQTEKTKLETSIAKAKEDRDKQEFADKLKENLARIDLLNAQAEHSKALAASVTDENARAKLLFPQQQELLQSQIDQAKQNIETGKASVDHLRAMTGEITARTKEFVANTERFATTVKALKDRGVPEADAITAANTQAAQSSKGILSTSKSTAADVGRLDSGKATQQDQLRILDMLGQASAPVPITDAQGNTSYATTPAFNFLKGSVIGMLDSPVNDPTMQSIPFIGPEQDRGPFFGGGKIKEWLGQKIMEYYNRNPDAANAYSDPNKIAAADLLNYPGASW